MGSFEEADLVDLVLADVAARAEIEEYLQRTSHVTPRKAGHDLSHKTVVCVERAENASEI